MEKEETTTRHFCDFCGQSSYNKCLGCGKDICWRCGEEGILAKKYPHAVHFSGSEDGVYCNECDRKLTDKPVNALHVAYRKIQALRDEYKGWYQAFDKKATEAEQQLKKLLGG